MKHCKALEIFLNIPRLFPFTLDIPVKLPQFPPNWWILPSSLAPRVLPDREARAQLFLMRPGTGPCREQQYIRIRQFISTEIQDKNIHCATYYNTTQLFTASWFFVQCALPNVYSEGRVPKVCCECLHQELCYWPILNTAKEHKCNIIYSYIVSKSKTRRGSPIGSRPSPMELHN